jgi:hypothetical protein
MVVVPPPVIDPAGLDHPSDQIVDVCRIGDPQFVPIRAEPGAYPTDIVIRRQPDGREQEGHCGPPHGGLRGDTSDGLGDLNDLLPSQGGEAEVPLLTAEEERLGPRGVVDRVVDAAVLGASPVLDPRCPAARKREREAVAGIQPRLTRHGVLEFFSPEGLERFQREAEEVLQGVPTSRLEVEVDRPEGRALQQVGTVEPLRSKVVHGRCPIYDATSMLWIVIPAAKIMPSPAAS